MYCGLQAAAEGADVEAKRTLLQRRASSPLQRDEHTPDVDNLIDNVFGLLELSRFAQLLGVVCIALLIAGIYLLATTDNPLIQLLAVLAMVAVQYALYVLVRDARRKQ